MRHISPISLEEALKKIDLDVTSLPQEILPVEECVGRIAAEDVRAVSDVPKENFARFDGYATFCPPGKGEKFIIVGENVEAGIKSSDKAVETRTGVSLPDDVCAVLPLEFVEFRNGSLIPRRSVPCGYGIVKKGAVLKKGESLLGKGDLIYPEYLNILSEAGIRKLKVCRKPRILVVPTGSEFVSGEKPEVTGKMITHIINDLGAEAFYHPPLPDDADKIGGVIKERMERFNAVVIIGGSGFSKKDYSWSFRTKIGGKEVFRGVKMRPGRTTSLFTVGSKPVLIVPGFPLAAYTSTIIIGGALIEKLRGLTPRIGAIPVSRVRVAESYSRIDMESHEIVFLKMKDEEAWPLNAEDLREKLFLETLKFTILNPSRGNLRKGDEVTLYIRQSFSCPLL